MAEVEKRLGQSLRMPCNSEARSESLEVWPTHIGIHHYEKASNVNLSEKFLYDAGDR